MDGGGEFRGFRGFRGYLDRPGIHEWFGEPWPPLGILLDLACRRLDVAEGRWAVWVGRRCWPYPGALGERADRLLARSIFIDPPDDGGRLWAIDLAARSPSVAVVVADGSGLAMASTRRLQLATESGSTLVLCARPARERGGLSAATTRWLVTPRHERKGRMSPSMSPSMNPRWTVELLRCKGVQPESEACRAPGGSVSTSDAGRRWAVEWKRAPGGVDLSTALVDRSSAASGPRVVEEGNEGRPAVRQSA